MTQAQSGDTVRVHYTGKLADGTVFDTSVEQEPLEFQIGAGHLIPGFENGVIGMKTGDTKSVFIPCKEAYGERDERLVWEVSRDKLPDDLEPQVGQRLRSVGSDGMTIDVVISAVSPATVTLDANHPLAGRDLLFDIELVAIDKA